MLFPEAQASVRVAVIATPWATRRRWSRLVVTFTQGIARVEHRETLVVELRRVRRDPLAAEIVAAKVPRGFVLVLVVASRRDRGRLELVNMGPA